MSKEKDPVAEELRNSLNLPQTDFSMRANLLKMEPRFQARWKEQDAYETTRKLDHPAGKFVFHDGPPYANGNIHIGHLLNKVLKDFVVRSHTMFGHDVHFVPGWDCHGLPIEHQVMKKLGKKAREMTVPEIRQKCEEYADSFVNLQRAQMQRLGTTGDYDNPYLTMKPQFEADTLEVFASLLEKDIVYRDLKPVHWSIANRTALADAELEYRDREDLSVFVMFEVTKESALPEAFDQAVGDKGPVSLLIWTTTPWTLPANLAVAVSERDDYGLYEFDHHGTTKRIVVAVDLAEKVFGHIKLECPEALATVKGADLSALRYSHPFIDRDGPVLLADYVTTEDGTGLVHTAPGHGADDYMTGLKAGLDIYCPVLGNGRFDDTAPEWLVGVSVWDGNEKVAEHLRESGHLFVDQKFTHSYPHDWRSKTPTIFRATDQWFISVDNAIEGGQSLRERAQQAVEAEIEFVPDWGKSRLRGMLESRPDWCISRQRSWGLPIPAFLAEDKEPLVSPQVVRAVIKKVAEHGSNIWFSAEVPELLSDYDPKDDDKAPQWVKDDWEAAKGLLQKSRDIFDVWFESGSSWNSVLRARDIGYPADLYLEGSDQHRGWFQLSLLPALGVTGKAPFKKLLTHGFVVTSEGKKMGKSLGNAIDVEELLKKQGADVCRWWVSSLNYTQDIKADWAYFKTASEDYRKVRNTIRFLLGNLYDFDIKKDAKKLDSTDLGLDGWVLSKLDELTQSVTEGYREHQYRRIRDGVFNFCNETISAVYLAAIKDRLYCEAPDSDLRRHTQTVIYEIVETLIRLVAPVLVHTADEAFLSLHGLEESDEASVHFQALPESKNRQADDVWTHAFELRAEVLKRLELAKESMGLNNALDAGIKASVSAELVQSLGAMTADLADLCGVSRFELVEGKGIEIVDLRSEPRCQRSWRRDVTVKERSNGLLLSDRDAQVLGV